MNIVRCAYVDENDLQCHATSGTPYADGWGNPSVMRHGIEVKEGWYCRAHSGALGQVLEDGALDDLHDDNKAA